MRILFSVIRRDLKLFFKDKGMFVSALITPLILLVLYATFLANVYKDSFVSALPPGFSIDEKLIDGTVFSQLVSALLAVSCITVSFCANLLMIQDKANGSIRDFTVTPVKRSVIAAGYYFSSAASTLIITLTALFACLILLGFKGWYMTAADVILVMTDVILLTLFGTALSSCINFFLSTNGQASAVGTIVSAGYGFICGAYMPISTFSAGLRKILMFLPGTYGTCLIKNHMMRGVFNEMGNSGFPDEVLKGIEDSVDFNIYFFDNAVSVPVMFAVLSGSVILFTGAFVAFNVMKKYR
ncbi:MAG: ABC transporter permease [Clostridia bacterium]|nr:ABC transporter permease [Clostridia bacterium]